MWIPNEEARGGSKTGNFSDMTHDRNFRRNQTQTHYTIHSDHRRALPCGRVLFLPTPCCVVTFNLASGTFGLRGVFLQYLVNRNDVSVRVEKDRLQRGIRACPCQDGHNSPRTQLRHGDSTFIMSCLFIPVD